ncbi:phage head-tail joining protein [Andreesenia angusta]|uniref:Phage head-tail joining protein n=1 Tax=Andreesenia angusta TaxID=39480 RepID=A0A1S1V4N3_9FIRM|nr:phage head closure protein [Andreesenia angusta]OHW61385.1 phage head-tail joining protein [Andreesenia angusta]
MNPGELRQRVKIIDLYGYGFNEAGEKVQIPSTVGIVWAKVIPIRGREYTEAKKIRPELQYRVTVRYRKDIHPSMILEWEGRVLKIEAVIDIAGRHTYMELNCVEEVDSQ